MAMAVVSVVMVVDVIDSLMRSTLFQFQFNLRLDFKGADVRIQVYFLSISMIRLVFTL